MEDIMKDLGNIWNQKTPQDRKDWVWSAGFTQDAAIRYSNLTWAMLPIHIRSVLIEQES